MIRMECAQFEPPQSIITLGGMNKKRITLLHVVFSQKHSP